MSGSVAAVVGGLALAAVVAGGVFWMRSRSSRGRAGRNRPLDPKERGIVEDELRRRKDRSGPTVAGGQHLR